MLTRRIVEFLMSEGPGLLIVLFMYQHVSQCSLSAVELTNTRLPPHRQVPRSVGAGGNGIRRDVLPKHYHWGETLEPPRGDAAAAVQGVFVDTGAHTFGLCVSALACDARRRRSP